MIAEVTQSDQSEQRADDIGGEDHGDAERPEAHLLLVQHVERDRQGSAQHHDQQDPGRKPVAAALCRYLYAATGQTSHHPTVLVRAEGHILNPVSPGPCTRCMRPALSRAVAAAPGVAVNESHLRISP